MTLPPEFDLIARYFKPLAGEGALDLSDDAAAFAPPVGQELVMAADALVEGVHFLPDDPPAMIAQKLLRVNLSDLAAMGATPFGYLMTMSLPRIDHTWLAGFTAGLAADQKTFGLRLLGGDTTGTSGPVVLSLTIIGTVQPGMAVRRNTARPGDGIWVTGSIGDGALGLAVLTGKLPGPEPFLADRYHLPQPRLMPIGGIARAAMDISDGFAQDLGHMCRASDCMAEVAAGLVPLSAAARRFAGRADFLEHVLTGGDDYELLMAVPPEQEEALAALAQEAGIAVTCVGRFQAGEPAVTIKKPDGTPLSFRRDGWSHFR